MSGIEFLYYALGSLAIMVMAVIGLIVLSRCYISIVDYKREKLIKHKLERLTNNNNELLKMKDLLEEAEKELERSTKKYDNG